MGRNAFAHESGIHQDGVLKNPLNFEIMTPQSVGLTSNRLTDRQAVGSPRASRASSRTSASTVEGEALDDGLPCRDRARGRQEGGHRRGPGGPGRPAGVGRRSAARRARGALEGWSVTSSHGGILAGQRRAPAPGRDPAPPRATGNGPVDALFGAVDAAVEPVLGWHPRARGLRDPRGLRWRGRPGPGHGPGASLDRSEDAQVDSVDRPRPIDQHHRGVARGVRRTRSRSC